MSVRILFTLFLTIIASCSSDKIITTEKNEYVGIFRAVISNSFSDKTVPINPSTAKKTNQWLSEFKQPVILISSLDKKNQATLVALGNNKEKLTWVSSDGISLTFDQGVLIATRGYSQDLISLKYIDPIHLFDSKKIRYKKVHRYLTSDNKHDDVDFQCLGKREQSKPFLFLEYEITVDKFIEDCVSDQISYKNEYDLLSGSSVVIKSKQWISPTNKYFLTYNLYAFQKL